MIINALIVVITTSIILSELLLFAFVFYKHIYTEHKNYTSPTSLKSLYEALDIIVANEIELYENNIFDNGGKIVTNDSFDNFYKDIMERINSSLSDGVLMGKFCPYMKKEYLIRFISRTVKSYLSKKIY